MQFELALARQIAERQVKSQADAKNAGPIKRRADAKKSRKGMCSWLGICGGNDATIVPSATAAHTSTPNGNSGQQAGAKPTQNKNIKDVQILANKGNTAEPNDDLNAMLKAIQEEQAPANSKNKKKKEADVDSELVMRCVKDGVKSVKSNLTLSIFDYGGQSVFNVIHHLFLTRYGVYVLVFNMEWLVSTNSADHKRCLSYLRFWMNSVLMHTVDVTNRTAPIVFAGTFAFMTIHPYSNICHFQSAMEKTLALSNRHSICLPILTVVISYDVYIYSHPRLSGRYA